MGTKKSRVDEAFLEVGKTPGIQIWRIEQLKVVPIPEADYGKFSSGDAYILLYTSSGIPARWNIHFWLGNDCSLDESGIAAYKSVELDDHLGGAPVQYREVEGHESKQFLSYFKQGIRYLEGGVASGFKHVDRDKFEKRLFQVKGKRNCRVKQVEYSVNSLNQGDVFILDTGREIFLWNGPQCSKTEKCKGAEIARQIRDEERSGKADIFFIDENWDIDAKFFKALGAAHPITIKDESEGGDDEDHEKKSICEVKLFKLSDEKGEMEVTEIKERPLNQDHLDTKDCYVLDFGTSGIYAWVGKMCSAGERRTVWQKALDFLQERGYPNWTPVVRVNELAEPPIFKQAFKWKQNTPLQATNKTPAGSNVATVDSDKKTDISNLHRRVPKTKDLMPDDGSGTAHIWRVEDFKLVPVEEKTYGTFYAGDSYLIVYVYKDKNLYKAIVYYWQGLKSSQDEKSAAALHSTKMDENMPEIAEYPITGPIRVVQNKEPAHFVAIFKSRLIVPMGGHASGFKNINDTDSYDDDGTRLFHIRDARVAQVVERASFLNTNDVFVLETPKRTYVWIGKGANEAERKITKDFLDSKENHVITMKDTEQIKEGEEPEEFWESLGGKQAYACGGRLEEEDPSFPARLFHGSNAAGYFKVEEILDFSQEDLIEDDVMLLDTFDEVFVWIGSGANHEEKKQSLQTALDYVKSDPLGRTVDGTSIMVVRQGLEPLSFTGHFHAWDADKWSKGKTYEDLKNELGASNVQGKTAEEELQKFSQTYPVDKLRSSSLPEGVDAANKERHLTEDDFKSLFGITIAEYDNLVLWKRINLKKKVGLF